MSFHPLSRARRIFPLRWWRDQLIALVVAFVAASALSLYSTGGSGWIRILLVHATVAATVWWIFLWIGRNLNAWLVGLAGSGAGPAKAAPPTQRIGMLFAALAAAEMIWLFPLVWGGINSLHVLPHVAGLALILVAPSLRRSFAAAWSAGGRGARMLCVTHLILALTLPALNFYHAGVRDTEIFPGYCNRGTRVGEQRIGARYGLACEQDKNRCFYVRLQDPVGSVLARIDLGSLEEKKVELPFLPVRMFQTADRSVVAAGYLEKDPLGRNGGMVIVDPDSLEIRKEMWFPDGAYWLEIEPSTGNYFVSDLNPDGHGGLTVYDPKGRVLAKAMGSGYPHMALLGTGVAAIDMNQLEVFNPMGITLRGRDFSGGVDVSYDERRDRLYVAKTTARLAVLDARSLKVLYSTSIPFGSRGLYYDPDLDLLFVGNPVLPSLTIIPIACPDEKRVLTDVPIGIRAFAVLGRRLIYTTRCGLYALDLEPIGCGGSHGGNAAVHAPQLLSSEEGSSCGGGGGRPVPRSPHGHGDPDGANPIG